jgi:hypothetical protein
MSLSPAIKSGSGFDRALASVETLALDEQEVFVEVVRRRIAAARRAALARDVAAARRDYRQGKVRRGAAADVLAELRRA